MHYIQSVVEDGGVLAEIRALAMRPSLEALGRFDAERVRRRFLDTFVCTETFKIMDLGQLAGLFVIRDKGDHLYLDHLYIHPDYQNKRLGRAVMEHIIEEATRRRLPVRLGALRNSPANGFYLQQGFVKTHEDDFDIYYEFAV